MSSGWFKALYDYEADATDPEQISLTTGSFLSNVEQIENGWCRATLAPPAIAPNAEGKRGVIPFAYLGQVELSELPTHLQPKKDEPMPPPRPSRTIPPPANPTQPPAQSSNSSTSQDDAKYRRMLKAGLPRGAIENAMHRDGFDPACFDFGSVTDPTPTTLPTPTQPKPPVQSAATTTTYTASSVASNDKYAKYQKMLKAGLPRGAIENAMLRDGVDPAGFNPDSSMSVAAPTTSESAGEMDKYAKMRKNGVPEGAIRMAMMRDGLNPDEPAPISKPAVVSPAAAPAGAASFLSEIGSFSKQKLKQTSTNESSDSPTQQSSNPLLAELQNARKSNLRHVAREPSADRPAPKVSGNPLLAELQGAGRSRLKKVDRDNDVVKTNDQNNNTSSGNPMMDLIKKRAQERIERAKQGAIPDPPSVRKASTPNASSGREMFGKHVLRPSNSAASLGIGQTATEYSETSNTFKSSAMRSPPPRTTVPTGKSTPTPLPPTPPSRHNSPTQPTHGTPTPPPRSPASQANTSPPLPPRSPSTSTNSGASSPPGPPSRIMPRVVPSDSVYVGGKPTSISAGVVQQNPYSPPISPRTGRKTYVPPPSPKSSRHPDPYAAADVPPPVPPRPSATRKASITSQVSNLSVETGEERMSVQAMRNVYSPQNRTANDNDRNRSPIPLPPRR